MIIEGYDISLLYMYNREAEEGITMSSTPAGHFSPPAEPQPISLSLTSEDNLLISYRRRGTWLRCKTTVSRCF